MTTLDATTVDWDDPCARARVLNIAYHEALTGNREIEIRTRTHDAEELVKFLPVDIEKLRIAAQAAQSECARATGAPDPNRRFPIRLGWRRAVPRRDYSNPDDPRG